MAEDVIYSERDEENTNPKCDSCGEPMDKAPEHIDADYLCHNDGCEGSYREEDDLLYCVCGNRIMGYDGKLYCPECVNM